MEQKRQLAGVTESADNVMKKFQSKQISEAATSCSAADRKSCIESAKQSFKDSGMKPRAFKNVKKLGEVMAAAEVYASCKQEGDTDAECDALAMAEFAAVAGATNATAAWASVKAQTTKLGQGIMSGSDIVVKLKEQLAVSVETSGTTCDDKSAEALAKKLETITLTKKISGAKAAGCMLAIDGKAEYSAKVGTPGFSANETDAASDALAAGLNNADLSPSGGRRLLEARRLATVTASYAAQESEFCASDDTTCGKTETFSTTAAAVKAATSSAFPQQDLSSALAMFVAALALMHW